MELLDLPIEKLFDVMIQLSPGDLRNFCATSSRIAEICQSSSFQNTYYRYHDQLTLEQRRAIDNILNQIVDKIADFVYRDTRYIKLEEIRNEIRTEFRRKIGRDLRQFIFEHYPKYLQDLRRIQMDHGRSYVRYFNNYMSDLLSSQINIPYIFLFPLSTDIVCGIQDDTEISDHLDTIIGEGMAQIAKMNGIQFNAEFFDDFEAMKAAIPKMREYEEEYYSSFPKPSH